MVNDLGAPLDGTGSSSGPADATVAAIIKEGGTAVASYDSVAEFEGAGRVVQAAIDNYGRLDVVCHLAGVLRDRMVFNMGEEEWDGVLGVHLYGAFNLVSHTVPHMIQQRYGRILLFSSISALGNSGQANYAAAKMGMVGLARCMAEELAPYGITVNAIFPAGETRMTATIPETAKQIREQLGITGGREHAGRSIENPRDPERNAPKCVYLATAAAGNISGQIIDTAGLPMSLYSARHVTRVIHKNGRWTLDELEPLMPSSLTQGLVNPSPVPPQTEQKPPEG